MNRLDWDTDFFGVPIGRASLADEPVEQAVAAARLEGIACLYLVAPGDRIDLVGAAVAAGARLTDLRLELDAESAWSAEPAPDVRFAEEADRPRVEEHAARLSAVSRFRADPRFPVPQIEEMYRIWARRCFDEGVVVVADGGFVGARATGGVSRLDLVYVAPAAAGRGLGTRLARAALAGLAEERALVVTQAGNIAALRLYERLGFCARSLEATLHLWLDEPR